MDDLERRFNAAMVSIYETSKRELGYNATRDPRTENRVRPALQRRRP